MKGCTRDHQVRIAADPVVGLQWSKSSEQHGNTSTAEVLRLRATSAVSRDQSVRRSAQDDDFVGVLTKNILNELALMGVAPRPHFLNRANRGLGSKSIQPNLSAPAMTHTPQGLIWRESFSRRLFCLGSPLPGD